MKKWVAMVVFSILCTIGVSSWVWNDWVDGQVIYLKGGETLVVDRITPSDKLIAYEVDGKTGIFMKSDIESIGSVRVEKKQVVIAILDQYKQQLLAHMGVPPRISRILDTRLLIFFFILLLSSQLWTRGCRIVDGILKRVTWRPTDLSRTQPAEEAASPFSQEDQESSDLRDIVLYFLELYKIQNGAPKDAPARFTMTVDSTKRKMKTFELGIKGSSDWLTRRMSIGPLGEESGSKSKCFYVIYDTHMVVKIPPVPVSDVEKYVTDIRRELQIAAQIAPIACIVPMVSVVLKKIKTLPYASSLTSEQLEKQYIRLIEGHAEYQANLKVGDRFAFFMELSNNFFLGRVIDDLHGAKASIGEEIRAVQDTIWDQEAFTRRYGLDTLPIFEGFQTLYQHCETEARRIVRESGRTDPVLPYQIRSCFLLTIGGDDVPGEQTGLDPVLMARLKQAFGEVFKAHPQPVESLVRLLKRYLETVVFLKSRHQIENIASNMLQLLCLLAEKKIALRDLKPDNLFLAADPDSYPIFLNNAEDFTIGVIDVETAVSLVPTTDGTIAQPILGGTPLYATPLHLLRNSTIMAYFGAPAQALHFQDWFATIAIIFKAVSGRNLFPRAARSFPEVLKILKSGRSKTDPEEATVKAMSQKFWSAATLDIRAQLEAFADPLNQLDLWVPDAMVAAFRDAVEQEAAALERVIHRQIYESLLLKSEKNRSFLLLAASPVVAKQLERWQGGADLPDAHRDLTPQMVVFLSGLLRLKQKLEDRQVLLAQLTTPCRLPGATVLEIMFQIVYKHMFNPRWTNQGNDSPHGSVV